ncbi:MAG: YqgE/AlgH family protein [Cyclobacteriaceae bacterium]|nr:YqgE/AlgH family protein [Cyclobacteriaceae bacterium]
MDFFSFKNSFKPEKGSLLLSEPFLPDPNFERTVVLLCEHNQQGSFGFVLNKPSTVFVGDIIEELEGCNSMVYIGGPVQQDTLHFLHQRGDLEGSIDVGNGLFWGGDFQMLKLWLATDLMGVDEIKFFLGYSGWSEGQLEKELEGESWIVADKSSIEVCLKLDAETLWKSVLKEMGGRFQLYSNYPVDPRLN